MCVPIGNMKAFSVSQWPLYLVDFNLNKFLYHQVKNWVRELRKMLGTGIDLAIAGNKTDLEEQRRVDSAVAEE